MAGWTRNDLLEIADKLRYDLTAAQGKLTDLKNGIAALPDLPDQEFVCPECGDAPWIKSQRSLDEHRYQSHGVELVDG